MNHQQINILHYHIQYNLDVYDYLNYQINQITYHQMI